MQQYTKGASKNDLVSSAELFPRVSAQHAGSGEEQTGEKATEKSSGRFQMPETEVGTDFSAGQEGQRAEGRKLRLGQRGQEVKRRRLQSQAGGSRTRQERMSN